MKSIEILQKEINIRERFIKSLEKNRVLRTKKYREHLISETKDEISDIEKSISILNGEDLKRDEISCDTCKHAKTHLSKNPCNMCVNNHSQWEKDV